MINYGLLVKKASRNVNKNMDNLAKPFGMTGVQMEIVDFIASKEPGITLQKEIEAEFNIRRSTTTGILQRMEKEGLIRREALPDDSRQKMILLTAKADRVKQQVVDYIQQEQKLLEEKFSVAELAVFRKVLSFYIERKEG